MLPSLLSGLAAPLAHRQGEEQQEQQELQPRPPSGALDLLHDAHKRDVAQVFEERLQSWQESSSAPFTILTWGDSTMMRMTNDHIFGIMKRVLDEDTIQRFPSCSKISPGACQKQKDQGITVLPTLALQARVPGFCDDLEVEMATGVRRNADRSFNVTTINCRCLKTVLDFTLAASTIQSLAKPPYNAPTPDLIVVNPAGLHHMHREDSRPFDETKHLVGSIDGYKELVRSGMRSLGAAFPAADLRLFSTHTVCDDAAMDHLKMRAFACARDDENCYACYDDVQVCLSGKCYDGERQAARDYFPDGAEPEDCTVPAAADRTFWRESLFSRAASDILAQAETDVFGEPEFAGKWRLVDAHNLTHMEGCQTFTSDGMHYTNQVEADEAIEALRI